MSQPSNQQAFDQAVRHHQAGRLQQADELYLAILAQQPRHRGAIHYRGVLAHQRGQLDVAVDLISLAISLDPNDPEAHNNLGNVLRDKKRFDEAIAACLQAVAIQPRYAEAHNNLGNALLGKGQFNEAIAAYRQAIAIKPSFAEAYYNLGNALADKGCLDDAIAAYRQFIALRPKLPEAHSKLGSALRSKGQLTEAIAAHRQAIALKPDYAEAHGNLGNALTENGQLDEAIAAFRQAIALRPNFAQAFTSLGIILNEQGDLDAGIAAFRQAISLDPSLPQAQSNLGHALRLKGQIDEAIAAYRQAVALRPTEAAAQSDLIFALHYHAASDPQTIAHELRCWNQRHAQPLRQFIQPHSNDPNPDRRLRIGYVSPDFRGHVVARNLLPLFQYSDHSQFEITCYAQVLQPDVVTRQFQQNSDGWRNIVGLSDQQVADQIRQDRIDILVDLAMHTGGNRLLAFALKPAPVQVTYLAYCGSTGLSAMDYRISDPYLDPPDADESCYSEKTIRLPRSYWCYLPGIDPLIAPAPVPARKNGFITFGCQNNFCKISPPVWTAWAAILRAHPNSKLLVYTGHGSHREAARKTLADLGIDPARLLFSDVRGTGYFLCYHQIDIALDPFPFCGGTTTCDALWMGVPVVTLSGKTAVGRGGQSILSNLGLPELIASTPDQYVRIAVDLANDLDRLDSLRRNMRSRLLASPLMDAQGFTRDMESAYRQMWRARCASEAK